jgi:hypothetical protein
MQVGQKVYSAQGNDWGCSTGNCGTDDAKKDDDWVQDAEVETDDKDDKWNTTRV